MGLLDGTDFDPQTQGLLAAAFQGLQASGPSRMPVSLGQIIGQGGMAGLNEYQQAMQIAQKKKREDALMELEKMRGQLTQAQIDKMKAEMTLLSGLGGADMGNPDALDSLASKLMMVSPDKANSLMIRAKDLRATQQERQTLAALRPTQGLIDETPTQGVINGVIANRFNIPQGDPMVQPPGATEPIPASVAAMGKTPFVANPTETSQLIPSPLMGGLLSSNAPGVSAAAGGLTQMMANPAFKPKSSLIEAQIEKLRASDTSAQNASAARAENAGFRADAAAERLANRTPPNEPAPSVHVVQDPNSPTGWGYRDFRTSVVTPGAPPPGGILSTTGMDERKRQTQYQKEISGPRVELQSYEKYQQAKETWKPGEKVPQAYVAAANQFIQMARGNARFKGDMDQALGGGNIAQRIWGSLSKVVTGEPSNEQLADLDRAMNAMAQGAANNIGTITRNAYSDVSSAKLNPDKIIGGPKVYGNILILPDGRVMPPLKSNAAALKAAQLWRDEQESK